MDIAKSGTLSVIKHAATIITIITAALSFVGFLFSLDKEIALNKQAIVELEENNNLVNERFDQIENKIDKIYLTLINKREVDK